MKSYTHYVHNYGDASNLKYVMAPWYGVEQKLKTMTFVTAEVKKRCYESNRPRVIDNISNPRKLK